MSFYQQVKEIVFSERFWMPGEWKWKYLSDPNSPVRQPRQEDLLWIFPMMVLLICIRYCFETFIFKSLGRRYGVKNRTYRVPEHNKTLTKFYRSNNKRPNNEEIKALASEVEWPVRKVDRWFHYKRNQKNSGALDKFSEGGWRGLFRATMFTYGIVTLRNKPHFRDREKALDEDIWPYYHLSTEIFFYYVIELAWYVALLTTMIRDISRRDMLEHFVHHVATVGLMYASYTLNLTYIGTLILVTLDCAEPWLEMAKMARHMRYPNASKYFYVCFFFAWVVSRLYVYPSIVYLCFRRYFEYTSVHGSWPAAICILMFLSTLSLVHLSWAKSVFVVTHAVYTRGDTEKELVTSESETESDDSKTRNGVNGHIPHTNGVSDVSKEIGQKTRQTASAKHA